jgi:malate dehydrogenase (quinone)
LLGASPGASTAVSIMVDLITGVLRMKLKLWMAGKLKLMIPSYGQLIILLY